MDTAAADDVAKQRFAGVIDMMRNPERSTFAFIMYPEAPPIIEAYCASEELATLDIPTGLVVANLVIPPNQATTPFTRARRAMQERYLAELGKQMYPACGCGKAKASSYPCAPPLKLYLWRHFGISASA